MKFFASTPEDDVLAAIGESHAALHDDPARTRPANRGRVRLSDPVLGLIFAIFFCAGIVAACYILPALKPTPTQTYK